MSEKTKLAKEVVEGDKVIMDDGKVATVAAVKRGFIRYENDPEKSVMLEYREKKYGWSQMRASDTVYVSEQ